MMLEGDTVIKFSPQLIGFDRFKQFRGNEAIESSVFPKLNLTAEEIFPGYRS